MTTPMDCHQAREQLNAFLDGELGEFESRQVSAHVDACQSCRHELDAYRGTRDIMRQFSPVPSPPHLAESIRIVMEKERLIPRRSPASSMIAAIRFPRINRLALAATFLLAVLASGSLYVYNNADKIIPAKAPNGSVAKAGRAGEKSDQLTLNGFTRNAEPPEALSMEHAEAPPAEAAPLANANLGNADESEVRRARAMSQATQSARDTMAFRGAAARPAPPTDSPRATTRRATATNSLDILVDEGASTGRGSGGGPGALPALAEEAMRSSKPFTEMSALLRELDSDDAPDGIAWNMADRIELAAVGAAAPAPEAARKDSKAAPSLKSATADKAKKSDNEKGKAPELNIILKARSMQPHLQQQVVMKQIQTHLDSGAAQIQNGRLVLNMSADETLQVLQSINADPASPALVPVPEKMLKNEIHQDQPRIVNTEIIFVADESAPAAAPPADGE